MDAVVSYLTEQAYRLRDLDSNSVDASMLEAAAAEIERLRKRVDELEIALIGDMSREAQKLGLE